MASGIFFVTHVTSCCTTDKAARFPEQCKAPIGLVEVSPSNKRGCWTLPYKQSSAINQRRNQLILKQTKTNGCPTKQVLLIHENVHNKLGRNKKGRPTGTSHGASPSSSSSSSSTHAATCAAAAGRGRAGRPAPATAPAPAAAAAAVLTRPLVRRQQAGVGPAGWHQPRRQPQQQQQQQQYSRGHLCGGSRPG
ncbi:hypothetical protein ACJJTC_018648 [Scirpophaga incertulas]